MTGGPVVTGDRTGGGRLTGHVLTGPVDWWTGEFCGLRSGALPRARDGLLTRVVTGSGDGLRLGDRLSYVLLVRSMCRWPTVKELQASQLRSSIHGS